MNRFGISLIAERLSDLATWVPLAEDAGFHCVGLTDSPSVYAETWTSGAVCAVSSESMRFGVRATNPVTRHPLVTASAALSLHELSGGRVMLGIGTGDSAVHQCGLRPATVRQLADYVSQVRALLRGEQVLYAGERIELKLARSSLLPPVPVYIAAAGPRTIRLAAEIADGIIIGTGIRHDIVSETMKIIRAGAKESGRTAEDLDLWWLAACRIAPDRAEAIEDMKSTLAAMCNATFRVTVKGKYLPAGLENDLRSLLAAYDFGEHVKPGRNSHNGLLLDASPALKAHIAERFLIGGSADDCVDQIRGLSTLGAEQFWWTMSLPDKPEFMKAFGEGVIAPLAGTDIHAS
jgi:5,10-methylenetetrahydromethanopterin reductase